MKIEPIGSYTGIQRIYPIPAYKNLEQVPKVEKISPQLEKSSRQIKEMDLFRYYAKKGIQALYPKGLYIDIVK